ncbi:protein FAM200C-like [Lycorma delicatula]|uniref:protein FAM200C-like n=1 Tax=Lycorma delicatula TaxID=130591 RepID=UPI003F5149B9
MFLNSAEILFGDLADKEIILSRIREIPVSTERRITDLAENVIIKQTIGLKHSQVFSVALDESTDLNDLSRLTIVARYYENNHIYEDLCCLLSLRDTTKAEDKLTAFISYFAKHDIDLSKLFCVTIDGAAVMVGKKKRFVKLLKNHINQKLLHFHCITHQESLCAKTSSLNLDSVMTTVVKIVNFLVSHSHLLTFKSLLQEIECEYGNLLLYRNVRWLSQGKVLTKFIGCLEAIKVFLNKNTIFS